MTGRPGGAEEGPRRITGSHVYAYLKCPRAAAWDLTRPRHERRPPTPWEEFALARGRDFEAEFVAALAPEVPAYPERDFARGAQATLELMRAGAPWIHQGVLLVADRLGIPDLLRRLPGASGLWPHHYEVVDVKTSGRPRGDQVLQVVFYSRLLALVQGRAPSRGALVLKDGREEAFAIDDFDAACAEVERDLELLRALPERAEPFLAPACESCHWNLHCLPGLEAAGDLSLVHGMSRGARAVLHHLGVRSVEDLATFEPHSERARGHLDVALVRRLRKAAQARLLGQPIPERRPLGRGLHPGALVHLLTDPFADRVLWLGVLYPARPDGELREAVPAGPEGAWPAAQELLGAVPGDAHLLHFGGDLPRFHEEQAFRRQAALGWEGRFVDLARRLRGAALYPGPVFGLPDLVRHGLGRDPYRFGHPGAAALWLAQEDGRAMLSRKGRGDLLDLAELVTRLLHDQTEAAAAPDAAVGSDP